MFFSDVLKPFLVERHQNKPFSFVFPAGGGGGGIPQSTPLVMRILLRLFICSTRHCILLKISSVHTTSNLQASRKN